MLSRSLPGICTDLDPEDADLFFSDKPSEINYAKSICGLCPVMLSCRATAQVAGEGGSPVEFGVWGGESADERLGRKPMGKAVYNLNSAQQDRRNELKRQRYHKQKESVSA